MKITITVNTGKVSPEAILNTSKMTEIAAILEDIGDKLRSGEVPKDDRLFDCESKEVGNFKVTGRTKKETAEYRRANKPCVCQQ